MNILNVTDLHIHREKVKIIENLSFQLNDSECLFLLGDIGKGKSTLLYTLLGFIPYQQGEIQWFNQTYYKEKDFVPLRGSVVGICFQNASDQLFGPTVLDDVAFGVLNQGKTKEEAYQIALSQLERLEILRLKNRPVNKLSGGEQNFTALAGVLAMQPKVLLLDEPTTGLDKKNKQKLISLLTDLKLPMIIASHEEDFVNTLADNCIQVSR
ncbi:energy-coupling factor ABC transporter ATP-binding protein [Otariodibacter sp.]|uniref:energy-coupling factor ABC transporter ATP-binding protein n=1 Tax=Otariodibacter sp. TaxID=3030919 RepID=UPI002616C4F6|nr:energy-coupling factor ABC transporter ATP-binding protein [Otariodibacter sp.]